jgi:hypothetical protein
LAKLYGKEYGYSFWMRFLVTHPKRMPNGKNLDWYFVSRLTTRDKFKDNEVIGDRTLAIF